MNDVVRGEASESEDENAGPNLKKNILAAELPGEATETSSDEDVYDKSLDGNTESRSNLESIYSNNLLQRKLIDNNLNIWRSLNAFVKNLVTPASKQLLSTDQLLIKSQLSMQSVLVTLNQTQSNVKKLYEKSDAVFTTNFIPTINIPPDNN
ncbi:biogenesis of lysosome-related organelles complex 1 subunit 3 [Musca domestica]|uniref:Biogenesis of lysosome-related organelles complex 1 subunit 3 n=1 Tax=Musca domestica TaxID=7370 RepID=A0A1I8MQR3_MUSDO|nr:biogenesis of lysosome-related organelles complex 1 subunit 3 [Musca domestica]XP_058980006.1 biogenesis of lysosome-related organelles complex 1 subunit 3 [Musca domestica]